MPQDTPLSVACLAAWHEAPCLDDRSVPVCRREARQRCDVDYETSRGSQAHRGLIYLVCGDHETQQKNIDATESFTYHAIYSGCPVAVLHTHLHVSETL